MVTFPDIIFTHNTRDENRCLLHARQALCHWAVYWPFSLSNAFCYRGLCHEQKEGELQKQHQDKFLQQQHQDIDASAPVPLSLSTHISSVQSDNDLFSMPRVIEHSPSLARLAQAEPTVCCSRLLLCLMISCIFCFDHLYALQELEEWF